MEIIARHYVTLPERLTMVHEAKKEVRRYTITTFTMKPQERQPIYSFFYTDNIKFGPSFKRKHSQVRIKYWQIQDPS